MIKDGGPVFPTEAQEASSGRFVREYLPASRGISLRDYFAAKAMQGMIAHIGGNPDGEMLSPDKKALGIRTDKAMAIAAYKYADAMLIERERKQGGGE